MPPFEQERRRRRSSAGPIIGVIALILIAGVGYYLFAGGKTKPAPEQQPETPQVVDDRADYASSTMRIAFKYPKTFTLNESYANLSVNPNKPIGGVKLTMSAASGTPLLPDTGISFEQLPRAKSCTGDIYLAANVKAVPYTDGTALYSVATSSSSDATSRTEEVVFAVASSSPCIAVRYFIHTAASSSAPFDRTALISEFDKIRQSLVMQ